MKLQLKAVQLTYSETAKAALMWLHVDVCMSVQLSLKEDATLSDDGPKRCKCTITQFNNIRL